MQYSILFEREKVSSDRLCYLFLIFLTGCLVGWIYEEIFYWITEGMLRNRGILYGPWLPIYGIGALVIYAMKPLKKNPLRPAPPHLRDRCIGDLCHEADEEAPGFAVLPLRCGHRDCGIQYRLCRNPSFRDAAMGLSRAVPEPRRDHLLSQRGELCFHGAGVPLSAGTGSGAHGQGDAPQNRSCRLSGGTSSVPGRLPFEHVVPNTDYLLGGTPE